MTYTPYDVYQVFKTIESDIKKTKIKILDVDVYIKRISIKNQDLIKQISDLFNTRFANVDLSEYIRCGFHHFKSFGFDKFFREIILNEYISRDSRHKRNPNETLEDVLKSLKFIDKPIETYLLDTIGDQKQILDDYIFNRIGPTVVVWCIWRNLWKPTTIDWEYLNVIQNNWPAFEKNVIKHAPMLDKWRKTMKGKK